MLGDLGKILRKAGGLSLVHGLTIASGIAATVAWTRLFPQESFGQYKVVIACLGVVSSFCLLGVAQSALMSASRGQDGNLQPIVASRMLANGFGVCGIGLAALYYSYQGQASAPVAGGLLAAALLFPLYNTTDLWTSWLNGKSAFRELALRRVQLAVFGLAPILLLGTFGESRVWVIVLCCLGILALQNALMLWRSMQQRENRERDPDVLHYGRHATVAMLFSSLLAFDAILLERYHSPAEVAIYAVALLFPDQLKALFSIFNQIISPTIYRQNDLAAFWNSFRRNFAILSLGFLAVGVAGFWLLPTLTGWFFTDRYALAADHGKWLWLVTAALGGTTYLGTALIATQKPVFVYAPYVGYPICLGALYLLWVNEGIAGMIRARIVATVLLAGFYLVAFFTQVRKAERHAA